MLVKKNTGEIQEVKRAIRVLNKEIEIKLLQKSKLNPVRDLKKNRENREFDFKER